MGFGLERDGERKEIAKHYAFSEKQVTETIILCCENPYGTMLLNSTKGREICRDFIYEFDDVLIEYMRENKPPKLASFCLDWVDDELCKSIFFTKETMKKMEKIHADGIDASEVEDEDKDEM